MTPSNRAWYFNSLKDWRKKWAPTKADLYRLKVLQGTGHPVAEAQEKLIARKRLIVQIIDGWIEGDES